MSCRSCVGADLYTNEEMAVMLAAKARELLNCFKEGRNPTDRILNHLECALMPFEMMKICGCRAMDDCNCEDA